ncbi:hypothetical protein acsn021_41890 [Anaerocolumna cellulosilytica]|uniref:Uncharacterized protein n=1 Tax=Anaerocolumna cellulosilytica TaxID=433286 RepID=A0A6S6RAV6_9FIRM|nr:hypothetical protein [Anaerocolumna cellulosilytica]MBB5195149.1 hypothetical protein [Anaerocolumna cellulosilytica]BCJ96620.1 hypothetical protein acsn021_41890 [Anaerocolumna cellulosilytica]
MREKEAIFRITLSVLFLLTGIFFMVERKVTNETIAVTAMSSGTQNTLDKANISKEEVVKLIDKINLTGGKDNSEFTYNNYLKNYLQQQDMYLTAEASVKLSEKLLQLMNLLEMEDKTDLNAMSLEGRELGIHLLADIYKTCGLKLYADYSGQVVKITDIKGSLLYQDKETTGQEQLQLKVLLCILIFLLMLFAICILLAKKNQLYMKDVTFDVQKKEGYA